MVGERARLLAAAVVALAVALTGCGRGSGALPAEPPAPVQIEGEATTAPPAEPTEHAEQDPGPFAPPDEPPPALDDLVGEDFLAMRRTHEAYRNWLYSHPDPDLLANIYHPDCECYRDQRALLDQYQQLGRWWIGEPTVVRSVEVLDHFDPDTLVLRVVLHNPGGQLIDAAGTVLDEAPRANINEDDVFFRDDSASPWLLRDFVGRGIEEVYSVQ